MLSHLCKHELHTHSSLLHGAFIDTNNVCSLGTCLLDYSIAAVAILKDVSESGHTPLCPSEDVHVQVTRLYGPQGRTCS